MSKQPEYVDEGCDVCGKKRSLCSQLCDEHGAVWARVGPNFGCSRWAEWVAAERAKLAAPQPAPEWTQAQADALLRELTPGWVEEQWSERYGLHRFDPKSRRGIFSRNDGMPTSERRLRELAPVSPVPTLIPCAECRAPLRPEQIATGIDYADGRKSESWCRYCAIRVMPNLYGEAGTQRNTWMAAQTKTPEPRVDVKGVHDWDPDDAGYVVTG